MGLPGLDLASRQGLANRGLSLLGGLAGLLATLGLRASFRLLATLELPATLGLRTILLAAIVLQLLQLGELVFHALFVVGLATLLRG